MNTSKGHGKTLEAAAWHACVGQLTRDGGEGFSRKSMHCHPNVAELNPRSWPFSKRPPRVDLSLFRRGGRKTLGRSPCKSIGGVEAVGILHIATGIGTTSEDRSRKRTVPQQCIESSDHISGWGRRILLEGSPQVTSDSRGLDLRPSRLGHMWHRE